MGKKPTTKPGIPLPHHFSTPNLPSIIFDTTHRYFVSPVTLTYATISHKYL
ncbi:MAG: hypothetical protein GF401_02200 [Chitinivibrionales bacterium]|nr:hypothetical protein [Chitinivibrionales bacterium]